MAPLCGCSTSPFLLPDYEQAVMEKQAQQKDHHDSHAKFREWHEGQRVMVRNLRPGSEWVPGVIVERRGPCHIWWRLLDRLLWKRRADHLKELGELTCRFHPNAETGNQAQVFHPTSAPPPALVTDNGSPIDTTEPAAIQPAVDEVTITSETDCQCRAKCGI